MKNALPQGSLILHTQMYRENSSNIFSSETTGQVKAKFHMDPQWIGGKEAYSPHLSHMTQLSAMPIYGKTPLKIFFWGTIGLMALVLCRQHLGHWSNKV